MNKIRREQISAMNIQYKYYPLTRFLDDTVRSGLSCIELWGAAPHFHPEDMTYRDVKNVRKEIESRALKLVCYTPEQCVYPINLAAPYEAERRRSLKFFEDAIRVAAELGSDKVLVTSGTGYFDGSDLKNAWKYAEENLSMLGEMAKDYGLRLALEVLRHDESNLVYDLKTLSKMLSEINMDSVCGMVDTIPMALAGETPAMYLQALGKKLLHIHFIDGAPRGHLAWGDGILDGKKYLSELEEYGYEGYLSLEITDGRYYMEPWKSIEQSVRQLFPLISK
ncbi:sugar phosphate isomerase/epimerase [Caproiciproducens sp. NJN-50]|uniref:sugar phosphate isomerase/epimerase family protein n=1 Tax=Caproiciproducens sp. NJN-50 TaxID=2507162 RepID=UPI000FFE2A7B|nr:sugar phosphate isomerase/epimerase [Caproiciproducens sp. NJN-50]QAT48964.1 sugar phosphate isomerase/epimerase [Caproiciproducens sp. NJN-50]